MCMITQSIRRIHAERTLSDEIKIQDLKVNTRSWKVACIRIREISSKSVETKLSLPGSSSSQIKPADIYVRDIARSAIVLQRSSAYDLVVDSAVLGNQGVDVLDVALVCLGDAVVLDGFPGAEELLLL